MIKEKLITQFKGKTFSSNEQVIRWLEKAIDQTREETIREVEEMLPPSKDGGKNFDQWQYYCQGYNDLRTFILNKLKK